ncbi:MAG TPA: 30S ribosomal protein S21 [Planctomycetota bacterium]|jgi:small subunit ribosomal protein S21|nr:30S ribosomal protein S21 [Planctomycetota bacterium]
MIRVEVRPGEPIDKAIRRLKRICQKENLMGEMRRLQSYEKPSERRRRRDAKRDKNRIKAVTNSLM